jgi:hypothetical protein
MCTSPETYTPFGTFALKDVEKHRSKLGPKGERRPHVRVEKDSRRLNHATSGLIERQTRTNINVQAEIVNAINPTPKTSRKLTCPRTKACSAKGPSNAAISNRIITATAVSNPSPKRTSFLDPRLVLLLDGKSTQAVPT